MATIATSRITAQNQISVPAEIRRRLGLHPGSVLEWAETANVITVRVAAKVSFKQMRAQLFPDGPPKPQTLRQLKQGIADYIEERHERRGY